MTLPCNVHYQHIRDIAGKERSEVVVVKTTQLVLFISK